jgi:hypothetical protein
MSSSTSMSMSMMGSPSPSTGKRVNFILSEKAHSDLANLAASTHRSMTDVVRLGLGLVKIAMEATKQGHHLVVTTAEGQPIKEIVLPD